MRRTAVVGITAPALASLALAALALVSGCSSSSGSGRSRYDDPTLRASDYDLACTTAADCVAIYLGELDCCGASCPNAAIAWASDHAYQFDVTFKRPICSPTPSCPLLTNNGCGTPTPTCDNGVCSLTIPDGGQM